MALRDVTRAIITRVAHATGYPVLVTEDCCLRRLAAVKVTRWRWMSGRRNSITEQELGFIPSTMLRAGISHDITSRLRQDGVEVAEE